MRRHGEDPAKSGECSHWGNKSVVVCPRQEEDRYGYRQINRRLHRLLLMPNCLVSDKSINGN